MDYAAQYREIAVLERRKALLNSFKLANERFTMQMLKSPEMMVAWDRDGAIWPVTGPDFSIAPRMYAMSGTVVFTGMGTAYHWIPDPTDDCGGKWKRSEM